MRGNVEDIVVIGIVIFIAAIVVLFSYMLIDKFVSVPVIAASGPASTVANQGLAALVIFGNLFVFVTIGFGIAAGISAFYTETHPVFFIFSVLMFSILMIVMQVMSDVFTEIASTGVMLPVANQFTLMVLLMQEYPIFAVLLAAIIFLGLYAKRSDIYQQGGMA